MRFNALRGLPTLALLALLVLIDGLLTGCAQAPSALRDQAAAPLTKSEAQARYQQGIARYGEGQFERALSDLDTAVASGGLKPADAVNARKYMAFIYCNGKLEAQCREQFQAILTLDSNFALAANEAENPLWGSVWVSVKGAREDKKAVTRGSEVQASKGQQKLSEGIKEYDAGHFKEALAALQAALDSGLTDQADQVRAYKYSAFSYCLTARRTQCHAAFHTIFTLDPAFALLPSEVGHPAWTAIYRKELAAAKRAQAGAGKKK